MGRSILDTISGACLTWTGTLAIFASDSPDTDSILGKVILAVIGTGGLAGGIWVMAKTIFARQERRIDYLEKQNAEQQHQLDSVHAEHSTCRESLARHEERLTSLSTELERFRKGTP